MASSDRRFGTEVSDLEKSPPPPSGRNYRSILERIESLLSQISELKPGYHLRKENELEELISISMSLKKLTKGSIDKLDPTSSTKPAHKMDPGDNQTPLLSAEDNHNQERTMEDLSNFAFLLVMLSYAVLYFIYSAVVGRDGDQTVMMCLHVWTIILVLLLFICSCIRSSLRSLKIVRLVMAGLLSLSGCVVFVLLQLSL